MKKYFLIIKKLIYKFTSKKIKNTEFLNWLEFANAGMLNEGNKYCFDYAIKNLVSNNPIIEIGSFCGLSTNFMSFLLRKYNKSNTLITCDKWVFEGGESLEDKIPESGLTYQSYSSFVKETFVRNISFFSREKMPHAIELYSDDFFQAWQKNETKVDVLGKEVNLGGPVAFAYVDGNHTYEFAKRDFKNIDKYLEVGGFILFDDSADFSGWGVCEVIKEIKKELRYEVVLKNPNYLVRKIAK